MQQLPLWESESQPVEHVLIECHYAGGGRRILDTANPDDREAFRDMSVMYAGFVPRPVENNITQCERGK